MSNQNRRFLIIGCGGIGVQALVHVKAHFEACFPQELLRQQVRFLGMDADPQRVSGLECREFYKLGSIDTLRAIAQDEAVAEWMNPVIRNGLHPTFFPLPEPQGNRQKGRALLHCRSEYEGVLGKAKALIRELLDGNGDSLEIWLITGLSGGTGSGLVVDLPYLLRRAAEETEVSDYRITGFFMMPPVMGFTDPDLIRRGDANAYAALKEIQHFMTLEQQNGVYRFSYEGGGKTESRRDLLDLCCLLYGGEPGIVYADPRQYTFWVLSDAMADMVCCKYTTRGIHGLCQQGMTGWCDDRWLENAREVYRCFLRSSLGMGMHLCQTIQENWNQFPEP